MRIILDTNILIYREQLSETPHDIGELLQIASSNNVQIIIHPISKQEIQSFKDEEIREINLSKIASYPRLENPPDPYLANDLSFLNIIDPNQSAKNNDKNDNILLYSIYNSAASLLITNDIRLRKKADKFNPALSVYTIDEALEYFKILFPSDHLPVTPLGIIHTHMYNVTLSDPIFDTLKKDYPGEFEDWFTEKAKEGRQCYITRHPETNQLGSIMIYKDEDEPVPCVPPLQQKKRLKIATLKVAYNGMRIGEALISVALNRALKKGYKEIYLTHFTEPDSDRLVNLITKHGFYFHGYDDQKYPGKREDIYLKKLCPENKATFQSADPYNDDISYYPSYCDNPKVKKFIVPIQPEYHDRLFLNVDSRQSLLLEHEGENIVEGYAILKAYLTRSQTHQIRPGDIIIFYKSGESTLSTIGVVDEINYGETNTETIMNMIEKRTVYSYSEVDEMGKPLTVILFRHNTNVKRKISLTDMKKKGILNGPPQSITLLTEEKYQKLITEGVIDENLTFD